MSVYTKAFTILCWNILTQCSLHGENCKSIDAAHFGFTKFRFRLLFFSVRLCVIHRSPSFVLINIVYCCAESSICCHLLGLMFFYYQHFSPFCCYTLCNSISSSTTRQWQQKQQIPTNCYIYCFYLFLHYLFDKICTRKIFNACFFHSISVK